MASLAEVVAELEVQQLKRQPHMHLVVLDTNGSTIYNFTPREEEEVARLLMEVTIMEDRESEDTAAGERLHQVAKP